jgi:hypothetical protein
MSDQRNAADSADSDGIGDFEFTIPQICTTSTNNEREIVGNMKMLSMVHAHPDQQFSVRV